MKYGDILLSALRKMFLNKDKLQFEDLSKLRDDKNYKTYLDGIHNVVNECIDKLLEVRPYIQYTEVNDGYDVTDDDEFKCIYDIFDLNGKRRQYYLEGDTILRILDAEPNETFTMYYESYYYVTESTKDSTRLPLSHELCNLIPLYLAGELYKDDDISLSTIYMNEFEAGLERLRQYPPEHKTVKDVFGVF